MMTMMKLISMLSQVSSWDDDGDHNALHIDHENANVINPKKTIEMKQIMMIHVSCKCPCNLRKIMEMKQIMTIYFPR